MLVIVYIALFLISLALSLASVAGMVVCIKSVIDDKEWGDKLIGLILTILFLGLTLGSFLGVYGVLVMEPW
jgi:hypothetical protein